MSRVLPLLLSLAVLQAACSSKSGESRVSMARSDDSSLPLPTADEAGIVDGVRFRLHDYLRLRDEMKSKDADTVFWVGATAILLNRELTRSGRPIAREDLIRVTRFAAGDLAYPEAEKSLRAAFGPGEGVPTRVSDARGRLDALLARAKVLRNSQVLAHLH